VMFLAPLVAATLALGCGQTAETGLGEARLVVARPALAATDISTMTLTVEPGSVAGQAPFAPFAASLAPSAPWTLHYSGIPAGLGRVLTLDAVDASVPPVHYRGSAVVDVPAGGTVTVAIPLQPTAPSSFAPNSAPVVDSLTIDAISVPIGSVVALNASAHDPDAGDGIAYQWSTTQVCGTFVDTSRPQTTRPTTLWVAPFDPRTCRLTLAVSDGRGATVSVYVDIQVVP
jgi:hypothetical protein